MASGPEFNQNGQPEVPEAEFARPTSLPTTVTRIRRAAVAGTALEAESQHEHNPNCCNYIMWNKVHRASLLTEEQVETYLAQTLTRMRGRKGKNYNREVELANVKDEIRKKYSGPIREYLNGSREVYDRLKYDIKNFCACGIANVGIPSSITGVGVK